MYILQKRYSEDHYFDHAGDKEAFDRESTMLDRFAELVKGGEYKLTDIRVLQEVEIVLEMRAAVKAPLAADPFQRR